MTVEFQCRGGGKEPWDFTLFPNSFIMQSSIVSFKIWD